MSPACIRDRGPGGGASRPPQTKKKMVADPGDYVRFGHLWTLPTCPERGAPTMKPHRPRSMAREVARAGESFASRTRVHSCHFEYGFGAVDRHQRLRRRPSNPVWTAAGACRFIRLTTDTRVECHFQSRRRGHHRSHTIGRKRPRDRKLGAARGPGRFAQGHSGGQQRRKEGDRAETQLARDQDAWSARRSRSNPAPCGMYEGAGTVMPGISQVPSHSSPGSRPGRGVAFRSLWFGRTANPSGKLPDYVFRLTHQSGPGPHTPSQKNSPKK